MGLFDCYPNRIHDATSQGHRKYNSGSNPCPGPSKNHILLLHLVLPEHRFRLPGLLWRHWRIIVTGYRERPLDPCNVHWK